MNPRALSIVTAILGLVATGAAFTMPPRGICDPLFGPAHALIAGGALLGLLAFAFARRAGAPASIVGLLGGAWAIVGTAALLVRTCAGRWQAMNAMDAAHAVLGALAVTLLLTGLSAKLRESGPFAVGLAALLAAAAGFTATRLAEARASDRTWASWSRLLRASDALRDAGQLPPGDHSPLSEVADALPQAVKDALPVTDGWGGSILFTQAGETWRIESRGSDGERGPYEAGGQRDFADDLVIENAEPIAWPERPCGSQPRAAPSKLPPPTDLRARRP
jgi:hypothetical protein